MKNINYNLVLNKHVKPQNSEEFGYWFAGLIDADGHITRNDGYVKKTFHSRDSSVAHYIKKVIRFGRLYRFKKVQAYDYLCTNKQGLNVISKLVLNNLKLPRKVTQFNERLAPRVGSALCQINQSPVCINNHWFAGFVQGDGSFQIRIRKLQKRSKNHQIEITLNIELKDECVLKQIKATFGGFVGYRKSRDTYYYNSINLTNATKLVAYFDKFQVMGSSYRLYLCWKRALNIVLSKQHLTINGFEEIKALKAYMTQLRT